MKNTEQRMVSAGNEAEVLLWFSALRAGKMAGYQFMRHYPLDGNIADFICKDLSLIIKIDDRTHYMSLPYERVTRENLEEQGYVLLKFSEEDVLERLDDVVEEISFTVESLNKNIKLLPN